MKRFMRLILTNNQKGIQSGVSSCIALTLLLMSSSVLNSHLFPAVATTFPMARELSTYSGAFGSVAFAIIAYRKPSLMVEKVWSTVFLALSALSALSLYVGIAWHSPFALAIGGPFGGLSSVWFSVLMGTALASIGPRYSSIAIPAAFVASYFLRILLFSIEPNFSPALSSFLYFALLATGYCFMRRDARNIMQPIQDSAAPTVLTVTSPSSYLPISSLVYLSILLFNFARGYSFAGQDNYSMLSMMLSFIPVIILLCLACLSRSPFSDGAYRISVILVFAGFLLVPLALPNSSVTISSQAANVLLHAGSDCFDVLMYGIIARVGSRNTLGAVSAAAFAFSAQWIGIGTGALISQGISSIAAADTTASLWASLFITFVFVAYNYLGLNNFSLEKTIQSVVPAHLDTGDDNQPLAQKNAETSGITRPDDFPPYDANGADNAPPETITTENQNGEESAESNSGKRFDEACEAVARRFGLTNRETDVLMLLGRGRTSPIIQEKLVLSHNTVKTHVRHIYAKLGVHSQQELISIIEHEREA